MKDESFYEASVIEGLETIGFRELRNVLGSQFKALHPPDRWPGVLQFQYTGDPRKLFQLKTILGVFVVQQFPISRPKALLGHQNFQRLIEQMNAVRNLNPKGSFRTFYLAAAGSDSNVMLRLRRELANAMSLMESDEEGDLLLRVRHPLNGQDIWEVLVRMSPRPLSTRSWRVCDYEGALNATVAYAMALLTNPAPADLFLNPACGSGTLLIERLSWGPARLAAGCDIQSDAIQCAHKNVQASSYSSSIQVYPWDACFLPFPNHSIDALVSDLPFGHLVGSHAENKILYPQLLSEAARVAKPQARFVLITHEIRMMDTLLGNSADWMVDHVWPITLNGLHPRIYVLRNITSS
jgi:SAM-dependent methyltransferase